MRSAQHYSRHRHGSARWSTAADLGALLNGSGPQLGYFDGKPLKYAAMDGPCMTIGGAGCGKLTSLVSYLLAGMGWADGQVPPTFLFDPAGQGTAIALPYQLELGRPAYVLNPHGLHGDILPSHRTNPLDFLTPKSPSLVSDCSLSAEMVIALSQGSAESQFFDAMTRRWVSVGLQWKVLRDGHVTLTSLRDFLASLVTDNDYFKETLKDMGKEAPLPLATEALEFFEMKQTAEKMFMGVVATYKNAFKPLEDPQIAETFSGNDFSLGVLTDRDTRFPGPPLVSFVIPGEFKHTWNPITRLVIGSTMLRAQRRRPGSLRPYFLIDEAATLGRAEFLLTAFSEGRKFFSTHTIYQSIGQLNRHFTDDGAREILSSCSALQFMGVRDLATAKMVSEMIGTTTLDVPKEVDRHDRRHASMAAWRDLVLYDVPLPETMAKARHEMRQARHHIEKQSRELLRPEEVLGLSDSEQVISIKGYPPILAEKRPYFLDKSMAGRYFPDPYHPPLDAVLVQTSLGPRTRAVVWSDVPKHLAHWPQHATGRYARLASDAAARGYGQGDRGLLTAWHRLVSTLVAYVAKAIGRHIPI
ncbi:type IV secretory system conjugative DNA transfer family protein [Accumulibacter sp.]|uniref:type IV secretory system conjugative DNA transfer family protein n=1 Tax=Accumulibacter sp. TaxID=2053492 RepID=UPI0025898099|nr:type IV secretory system conjugative DNA transfer family protein [Accumulibacter sp.]